MTGNVCSGAMSKWDALQIEFDSNVHARKAGIEMHPESATLHNLYPCTDNVI
jgi:hypothetical protein